MSESGGRVLKPSLAPASADKFHTNQLSRTIQRRLARCLLYQARTRLEPHQQSRGGTAMKTFATRAFVVVAVSMLLVVWASRLAACTGETAGSMLPEFRALTSIQAVVI
jgi:hypothetical protein